MSNFSLYQYIDYQKLWNDLCDIYKEGNDLFDCVKLKKKDLKKIKKFMNENNLPLTHSMCTIQKNKLGFIFSQEIQTASEGNPQNEWFSVSIGYNLKTDEFLYYEEDQG